METNSTIDFKEAVLAFTERKVFLQPDRLQIKLPDAKEMLDTGFRHFVGDNYTWLPEYNEIAEWMTDNRGKGLFCMGNCGRGKTTITMQILPCVLLQCLHRIVTVCLAREMNRHYDEIMQKRLLVIDDIGREEPYRLYGNRFNVFPDYVDDCEIRGKFLITSTNCTLEELTAKYGHRTLSRLKTVTKLVVFAGEDLRQHSVTD